MKKLNLKPKAKKVFKSLGLTLIAIFLIYLIYNIYFYFVTGNQKIDIIVNDRYYSNSNIVGQMKIKSIKDKETKSGDVKFILLNSEKKKVGDKAKYEINGEILDFEIPVENLETGNYFIQSNVSTNNGKDKILTPIYISKTEMENVTITLDKGIYKPGDNINYRVLVTSAKTDKPLQKEMKINIYDGNSNRVYSENVKSSDFGIISGNFKLADEVNSGTYKIEIESDNIEKSKEFKVNPYTIDKFETKVQSDKESYQINETMKLEMQNTYFYGEPVKNANVKITIKNPEDKEIVEEKVTNENGKISLEYKFEKIGKYEINIVTTDVSNYVVEESKNIYVKQDAFEIELIPETQSLVAGENNIYVFTKTIHGTPIKSYLNIKSDTTKKQVMTDENGIGMFKINISSFAGKTAEFEIEAKNENQEAVNKTQKINIDKNKTVIITDKVKYNINEDIQIMIKNSGREKNTIGIYKNKELIKVITTEEDNTKVNLGDISGIIDVELLTENNKTVSPKRTIFIKSDKGITINLETDKEEYQPGEKINLKVDSSKQEDTAILVSVLDEAVQKLSDNDLNIDNIKLALSSIKFTDYVDAATLYTNIVENKSEQSIMGILLKQNNESSGVNVQSKTNYQEKRKALKVIKAIGLVGIILAIIMFFKKKQKFRNFVIDIINLLILWLGISALILAIISTKNQLSDSMNIFVHIITLVATGYIYYLIPREYKTKLITGIITSFILLPIFEYIYQELEDIAKFVVPLIAIIAIEFIIISKEKNKFNKTRKVVINILKIIMIAIFSLIVTEWIEDIAWRLEDIYILLIYLSLAAIMNSFSLKMLKNFKNKSNYKKILEIGKNVGIIILAVVALLIISSMDMKKISNERFDFGYDIEVPETSGGGTETLIDPSDIVPITPDAAQSQQNILDIFDIFSDIGEYNDDTISEDNKIAKVQTDTQKQEVIEENIRNVFLESMCFIPDKIAENGNTNIELQTSDNITTWDIQVVGNNKNGDIGYASKNVRVFKDFFLDYELPNNLKVGDKISLPITVNNYTEAILNANIIIEDAEWFNLDRNEFSINVEPKTNKMEYVTFEIIKDGKNKLRIEAMANDFTDIVEKQVEIEPDGYKVSEVVSAGVIEEKETQDIIFDENILEGTTRKSILKIYSSQEAHTIEGIESMLKMPTGCFEQVSSSLYPDIMILKNLKETGNSSPEIEKKALEYIQKGYQKLLTYEVKGTKGGYSLYGKSPANPRLTSYGLMQMEEMSDIYNVDQNVMNRMRNYILSERKQDGSFDGNVANTAYIVWNFLQAYPEDKEIEKSIDYLKDKSQSVKDNYTKAMVANCLVYKYPKEAKNLIDEMLKGKNEDYYNGSSIYGTRGNYLSIETKAVLSIAMSKLNYKNEQNKELINEILGQKDAKGNWYSTQTTAMVLKALNNFNDKKVINGNKITIIINGTEEVIEIDKNSLNIIQKEFDNLDKENKLEIISANGQISYEIINEYYIPYTDVKQLNNGIEVKTEFIGEMKVTNEIKQNINITNTSKNDIQNGQIKIQIPQGFKVDEQTLEKLKIDNIIEKYEMNYRELYIYISELEVSEYLEFSIEYRAQYPIEVKTGQVEVYDYYNPSLNGIVLPQILKVEK